MPTYDYVCDACAHAFEHFQGISEPLLVTCPKCRRRKLRRLIGAGIGVVFKGSGFYETDYKRVPADGKGAGKGADKAPTDKAPSDKAPADKAPADKAPADKASGDTSSGASQPAAGKSPDPARSKPDAKDGKPGANEPASRPRDRGGKSA